MYSELFGNEERIKYLMEEKKKIEKEIEKFKSKII